MKAANIDMKSVVVGGVDATQDALAAMQADELDATVFQDAAGQGAGALTRRSSWPRARRSSRRSIFRSNW